MLFRKADVAMVVNIVNGFHCLIPRMFGKPVAIASRGHGLRSNQCGS